MKTDYLKKAYKIANDINEGIDCGESRQILRKCIMALMDEMERRHDKKRSSEMDELIKTIQSVGLQTCQDCPNILVCHAQGKCYRKSFRTQATTAKKQVFKSSEDGYCWNCGDGLSDHGEDLECKNPTP